jgi:hypothetical protein
MTTKVTRDELVAILAAMPVPTPGANWSPHFVTWFNRNRDRIAQARREQRDKHLSPPPPGRRRNGKVQARY